MAPENTAVTPQSVSGVPNLSGAATPGVAAASPAQAASAPSPASQPVTTNPAIPQQPAPATQPFNPEAASLAAAQSAANDVQKFSQESTAPPAAGPHARLLSMVQGLAVGAGAFGRSLATHGKEGGVDDVLAYQNQQKQQQIQAQQARDAAKNQKIQQAVTAVNTNLAMANGAHMMATLPGELTAQSLRNTADTLKIKEDAFNSGLLTGDFSDYFKARDAANVVQGGTPTQTSTPAPAAPGTVLAAQAVPPQAIARWQGAVDIASETFKDDPAILQAKQTMADPKSTPEQKASAAQIATNRMTALGQGVKIKQEQEALVKAQNENDILFKYESDPKQLADPGAQAALEAWKADPAHKSDIAGQSKAQMLLDKADIAQKNAERIKNIEAVNAENAKVAATSGKPEDVGPMLARSLVTLADLKTRGTSVAQISADIKAAQDYAKANGLAPYNPADEITGEQQMKSPANLTFFGSARSLVQKGGMLDRLQESHDALGNKKIPVLNSIDDWAHFNAGSPELSAYQTYVLAGADDYAKVMGGGNPTIEQFKQLENQFIYKLNNQQLDAVVAGSRDAVQSQVKGKIGNNNYIMQRNSDILDYAGRQNKQTYARPAGVSGNAKLMQAPGGQPHWIEPQNQTAAKNAGAVEITQ